jgi:hypothetical protein
MRTVSSQSTEATVGSRVALPELETFSTKLSDGREITIREMTGRDLLYMEDELTDMKETRRSFHLLERLNVGPNSVSFDDIADLSFRDIKALTELVTKVSEIGTQEGKEDPK